MNILSMLSNDSAVQLQLQLNLQLNLQSAPSKASPPTLLPKQTTTTTNATGNTKTVARYSAGDINILNDENSHGVDESIDEPVTNGQATNKESVKQEPTQPTNNTETEKKPLTLSIQNGTDKKSLPPQSQPPRINPLVADVTLSTSKFKNVLAHIQHDQLEIDLDYKFKFESNVSLIDQLDKNQRLSQDLRILKFDEVKSNNYLISTHQFTTNYIDRVVAEDISSRNNKISDTNKNKEIIHIDHSKPLHHNSTRGKEYKWGSTREIHKVESKPKRKRNTENSETNNSRSAVSSKASTPSKSLAFGSTHHVPIRPKGSKGTNLSSSSGPITDITNDSNNVRRSSRPKSKRKAYEDGEGEDNGNNIDSNSTDNNNRNKTQEGGRGPKRIRIKLKVKPEGENEGEEKDEGKGKGRGKGKGKGKGEGKGKDGDKEEEDENNANGENGKSKGSVSSSTTTTAATATAAAAGGGSTGSALGTTTSNSSTSKEQKAFMRQYDNTYVAIWKDMSRKDGPKVSRLMQQSTQAKLINLKKTCILAAREAKRWQVKNTKNQKDLSTKARRAMREMFNFWKRNERIERELKKKHEKELVEKAKREEEERESKRQSRKLNFLITQTELYSHFIGKKIKTDEIEGTDADPRIKAQEKAHLDKYAGVDAANNDILAIDFDNDDEDALHRAAAQNAQNALANAQNQAKQFDETEPFKNPDTNGEEMNFQNPTLLGDLSIEQPKMLKCTLKEYQIKGLNWLANLYEQGINGILADEMGLGKTVQSISVLSYLAETHNIWGPFLVVTPASTLHNWQQEISKFVPNFKVLPYWGHAKDRKVLRKFWDRKSLRYDKDAPFHVLVTSYQLIVSDIAYFQKMKWQYMILDEAQAIKSSQSSRWKSLLSLSCRNRLLLTGTPIQNSMQELWALLHFIMPTLFDSHDEFSDWFSKDIESHAQSNTGLDEQQLRRLHMILKPFMLRRIKKNVQSELGDKVEIDLFCDLTNRQKKYYQSLRSQISIMDLIDATTTNSSSNNSSLDDSSTTSLVNLVMQFRKVCNHPDLFERADVRSPMALVKFAETGSFLREGNELDVSYASENLINYNLPRLIYDDLISANENKNDFGSVYAKFSVYDPENLRDLGWISSAGTSPNEIQQLGKMNVLERAIKMQRYTTGSPLDRINYLYEGDYSSPNSKLLINAQNQHMISQQQIENSSVLLDLCNISQKVYEEMYLNTQDPAFTPLASAPPITIVCSSNNFQNKLQNELFNPTIRSALAPMSLNKELEFLNNNTPLELYPPSNMLPSSLSKVNDYSNIRMPSMDRFITESGKLAKLDELLVKLKQEDHRVLIYFQMTKMMDLMEEYLTFKQHKYIRLDGSSKLDDRRDLVHDWQTKPEIFVFLLSTRAGGLGINLTAADTVVFYDSDWNPTIDSQAMDRAHRLGQTRQVTVYRLLTRNTIEERMRDRAKQKEQVQQVVMEGKATTIMSKKEDAASKKKDVAFLLLGGSGDGDGDGTGVNSGVDTSNDVSKSTTPKPEVGKKKNNGNKKNVFGNGKKRAREEDGEEEDALNSKRLQELYHEGEGEFSGTVTPAPGA